MIVKERENPAGGIKEKENRGISMKNKNRIRLITICISGILLTGCANQYPNLSLTEADKKLVANYASGILMSYNAGSNMRVLSGIEYEIAQAEETARLEQEARRQQLAQQHEQEKTAAAEERTETAAEGDGSGTQVEVPSVPAIEDMGSFLSLTDSSISYQYYEVLDSYVGTQEASAMAMDAGAGKKLLVAHFGVSNNSDQVSHLDILSQDIDFALTAGGERIQAEFTLLLNDLSMYKGDLEPGASLDTVLVFEITEEQAAASPLQILVTAAGGEGSINL